MKSLIPLLFLFLLITNCMVVDLGSSRGDGIAVTEIRPLSSFSRVDLECAVHLTIKSGPEYAAYVTSDGNLSGYFHTDAFGGVLTVGLTGAIDPVVTPEIVIMVPDIQTVIHNGNGTVEILEGGHFPNLKLQLNGGGDIHFSGTATHLQAQLNGAGKIILDGFAALLTVDLRGSGEVSAENLLVEDADVELSGSGNIYLDLDYESNLNLVLSGSGNVEWWGAPKGLYYNLIGSGKIIEHRGLPKKSANGSEVPATKKTAANPGLYELINPKKAIVH